MSLASRGGGTAAAERAGSASTLSIIKAQIVFLLSTLTEDSYVKNEKEINALIEAHGADANIHLVRRLVQSAAPALASQAPTNATTPTPPPQLHLRLLSACTRKLARDPLLTHRFREAILAGFNDTSSGSASSDAFRQLGDLLPSFCERAGLTGVERLVLALEMTRVLIAPAQAPNVPLAQQTPSVRNAVALHAKSKDFGLAAVQLLRESWQSGVEGIAAGQASDVLGPVALSRLLERVASDWCLDADNGEVVIEDAKHGHALLSIDQKRDFMRALRARLGFELASQVAMHALESARFASSTSPVDLLHRLIPDPSNPSQDLIRSVLQLHAHMPNPPTSPTSETKAASLILDLIDLFSQQAEQVAVDPASFVRALADFVPSESPLSSVLQHCFDAPPDDPQAILPPLPETWGLKALAAMLAASAAAAQALWADWINPARQLSLIDRLLLLPAEALPLGALPELRKAVAPQDVSSASPAARDHAQAVYASVFNCYDFTQMLMSLAASEQAEAAALGPLVNDILERGIRQAPELLLIALTQMPKPWSTLQNGTVSRLFNAFLHATPMQPLPGQQLAFYRLWQIDQALVLSAFQDWYATLETNITRVVDVAQETHILINVLDARPWRLALDAAALSSRREYLDLSRFLQSNIARHGAQFVKETLGFVGSKVRYELKRNEVDPLPDLKTLPLTASSVAVFMRALRMNHELFTAEDVEHFKEVRTLSLQLHPRLLNFAPGADQEPGMAVASFDAAVEHDAEATFRRMYEGQISVDGIIAMLQQSRDSADAERVEFYQCMLHCLMDEMRFVSTYPPQELALTAQLFGNLIQHQVVDHIPLGIAVRYVLDALKHPPSSANYRFGVQALVCFQSRLQEWPQLANAILNIGHISTANPEVAGLARDALAEPGNTTDSLALPVAIEEDEQQEEVAPAFTALQAGEPDADIEQPDEEASDKILFTINNLAPANIESKYRDAGDRLEEVHYRWLANYLVSQRVCIEPNNHGLYLQLLDLLGRPQLHAQVLYESFVKSAALLNSEKTVSSSTERTLLKNLGSWLGSITLARNKPIKHDNLAFKELLIQGFDSNRLIVAIPFVCKILEQCAKSRVFKPPNPWLMAIVRLLVELYQFAELKLNLKFEIEVLCKSLNVDLKEVEPTQILRNRPTPQEQEEAAAAAQKAAQAKGKLLPASTPTSGGPATDLQDSITAALRDLPNYVVFSPHFPYIAANPAFKRAVLLAIDRAVREIILPVVERSVTIAGISTRELTLKDFATEGDDEALSRSGQLMAQNLAGSLALVTCKEPLRLSIIQHLKTWFIQSGIAEHSLPEQAISVLASDNLELACSAVERVAKERAILEVDDALSPAVMARRRHREQSSSPFWDSAAMPASQYTSLLPDPLRLKQNGLQPQQLQVYADFGKPLVLHSTPDGVMAGASPAGSEAVAPAFAAEPAAATPALLTVQQAVDKFNNIVGELDAALQTQTVSSLSQLPPNSDIAVVLAQLPVLAARSVQTNETAYACSQNVVKLLYSSTTDIGREVYATLLQRLCQLSDKVKREVTSWLIYAQDERKHNGPVIVALIKHGILPLPEYESHLARNLLQNPKAATVDFLARLVRHLLNEKPPLAAREQLVRAIDALATVTQNGSGTELSSRLLDDLRLTAPSGAVARVKAEDSEVKEQLTKFFVQWVRSYQSSANVEQSFVDYVVKLQENGVLKGENLSSRFFRTCTEVCVDNYIKQTAAGGTSSSGIYQPVDALGALIAFMLKYHGDGSGDHKGAADAKAFYLSKVLSIVVLVLGQSHEELGPHFAVAQKPFYRLLSSIFSNLSALETHLGAAYPRILVAISNALLKVQPAWFPGFAFSWIALMSHRLLLPKMLRDVEGQACFHRLLMALLEFIKPFLTQGPLSEPVRALYMATCKLFLVLLHDSPEFLVAHHNALCDMLPSSCLQLQNIVLSAFPLDLQLPDPFGPKAGSCPELSEPPLMLTDYGTHLNVAAPELHAVIHQLLHGEGTLQALADCRTALVSRSTSNGQAAYSRRLMTSTVMTLLNHVTGNKASGTFEPSAPAVGILSTLLAALDPEGRYTLLSSLAAQLRYPNTHSRWTSACFLHLFDSPDLDNLTKEIVLRVLLERVSCMRPHPWALILTLVELLRRHQPEDMECLQRPELQNTLVPLLKGLRLKC